MVMLGTGAGLKNGVMREFEGGATNSFFVWTQRTQKPWAGMPAGRNIQLANADVQAIRDKVPETAVVAPRNQLGGYMGGNNVSRGRKTGAFSIMGDYPEIQRIQSFDRQGRFLSLIDIEEIRKVAVIGAGSRSSFSSLKSIRSANRSSSTASIFKWWASSDRCSREMRLIATRRRSSSPSPSSGHSILETRSAGWRWSRIPRCRLEGGGKGPHPAQVASQGRSRRRAGFRAFQFGGEEYDKIAGLFHGIRTLVWLVGIGTLAAGAIGVSNIMLIIVKERTKEIGIRRAVGAKPSAIVGQIVLEAMILTALAGYLGMVAGIALIEIVGNVLPEVTAPACSSIRT